MVQKAFYEWIILSNVFFIKSADQSVDINFESFGEKTIHFGKVLENPFPARSKVNISPVVFQKRFWLPHFVPKPVQSENFLSILFLSHRFIPRRFCRLFKNVSIRVRNQGDSTVIPNSQEHVSWSIKSFFSMAGLDKENKAVVATMFEKSNHR